MNVPIKEAPEKLEGLETKSTSWLQICDPEFCYELLEAGSNEKCVDLDDESSNSINYWKFRNSYFKKKLTQRTSLYSQIIIGHVHNVVKSGHVFPTLLCYPD